VKPRKKVSKPVIVQAQAQARRAIIEEARQTVDRVNRMEREWKKEFERHRLAPLTDKQFWEACKNYFPAELHTPAATWLLKMFERAQRADAEKGARGRPPGIGSQVEELMTGPLGLDQKMARRLVAFSVCKCLDENGHPALLCTCDAYACVADLHKQFLHDQRNPKPKRKRKRKQGAGKAGIG
jgi:hypothetical protein